ncbi:MAG: hypothetical protein H7338_18725 [Candidatus Sericytochromatia bacterium]|nr:hypothetical protein [Candidatus Sericytochromatia bacterium]
MSGLYDRTDASTAEGYKCAKCGAAFTMEEPNCPVCGFACTPDTCQIIAVSKEGF